MKLKKKSGLIGAVIALSCASLVSVGFASWVISQGATEAISGSIAVDTVTDKSYSFSDWTNGTEDPAGSFALADAQRIVYGYAAYDATTAGVASYDWLRNDDKLQGSDTESSAENLRASFTFKIKSNNQYVGAAAGPAASLALDDGLGYAVSISAITPSKAWTKTFHGRELLGDLQQPTLSYAGGVFTCNITFVWGSYFTVDSTVVNPMTYFNSKDPTLPANSGLAAEAKEVFEDLEGFLDGVTYDLTLSIAKAA